ncbi:hypothetical protein [Psychrobacillus sp. OK032]|uniref:hypothetical protein n=1 Tax=Psychrobacillus sp. OK032 TaxID=1884358 RepID=UPI0008CBFB1E|nr:hypothetical protein [Psychrobacillus sp. OK032]SES09360.1 hypothetical protein SAMN05518872_104141 [Psychrobacillus sp. OK032]
MSKEMTKKEAKINDEVHITYYFSVLFTILGTLSILVLLHYKVENLGLFTILLSISAGGLPSGVVGAFIDYKISEYKLKSN